MCFWNKEGFSTFVSLVETFLVMAKETKKLENMDYARTSTLTQVVSFQRVSVEGRLFGVTSKNIWSNVKVGDLNK